MIRLRSRVLTSLALALPFGVPLAAQSAAPASSPPPSTIPATELRAVELESYTVLGSRVRQYSATGPSPVSVYDQDFIRATGALSMADFLNYLPQNYGAIGAGRGSAPNEFNPEFGQRTETTTPLLNFVTGAATVTPGQTGVTGASLRGLGSGSTLILVDGRRAQQSGAGNRSTDSRQGFVDLNTIPFAMVERIEVITDGASALYGADAVAGVINIVLKKDWVGHELSGSYKGSFDGGGRERLVSLVSGFAAGKLRGTVSVSHYDRAPLKASQRDFSREQDRRSIVVATNASGAPIYGRDFRLNWGYPAVVQAQGGTVVGTFDALPGVRVVLVPEGATATPAVSAFIPATTPVPPATIVNASGQRRANTSEFPDLIPESENRSFAANATYSFNDRLEAFGSYSFTTNRGLFHGQVAVSSASATSGFGNFSTVVPAAMNPFGQNVFVGLVHYEFGALTQRTRTDAHSATVGLRGKVGQTWEWEAGLSHGQQERSEVNRLFNGAGITALLNNPDASLRLNPFVDARAPGAPNQTALYERLALYPTFDAEGQSTTLDFSANGDLFAIWGGPIRMAWGGSYTDSQVESQAVNYSIAATPVATRTAFESERSNHALFAEVSVPLFGRPNAQPLLQRVDLQLAARYESYERAGDVTVPKVGISWVPVKPILLRASYSEGFRPPALTEYQVVQTTSQATVSDPRRTPPSTTGIAVTRGSRPSIESEDSENTFAGIVIEPPFAPGLRIESNFYRTRQFNVIQTLNAQTVVNNEALFPERITRAAPDPAVDGPLNQPGRITGIDITFVNFGRVENESMDVGLDYVLPWRELGRWRFNLFATRTLESLRQLAPGQPPIVDDGDTFAPPKWRFNAAAFWSQGPWTASIFATYLDGFRSNLAGNTLAATYPVASATKVDVRGGYEFRNGVWRGHGKGLRLSVGIGNVFDREPPYSDTVFGYNGGLHSHFVMGRTYDLSFNLPF
jgi:iron complex outermembrane recepter protein